ncbi:selenoprotein [bacterium]|nr:MAG: selenoprotein [bacterium]
MPHAAGLADAIRDKYGYEAELIASGGGVFEVTVDGKLVFSKKELDRFPAHDEVLGAIGE